MSITLAQRDEVRRRASYACEFCTVTETDAAGQLTIDHFRPQSKGGDDSLDNLLYSCVRCNLYKQDYWPEDKDLPLWNPRHETAAKHLLESDDGRLVPLTAVGEFTIKRLRLNRGPLVAYRQHRRQQAEALQLLTQYRDLVSLLTHLNTQLATLTGQQHKLLAKQRELLRLLLGVEEE
jgi:hypothetical protein